MEHNQFKRKRIFDEPSSFNFKKSKKNTRLSSTSSSSSSSSNSNNDEIGEFRYNNGENLLNRYIIRSELGKGTFGKVLKCFDKKYKENVAIKVIRSVKRYIESARTEAKILDYVNDKQIENKYHFIVKLFSRFYYQDHYMMVFEPLGKSLYDIIKQNNHVGLPLFMIKSIIKQLLQTLDFLRTIELIHTDLKLENVLFVHRKLISYNICYKGKETQIFAPENPRIKIIDFGGATYLSEAIKEKNRIINTRQYRGPEVILEIGWSFPSDVWSVGCILAEIFSGDLFFQTHDELEHLALIEKVCGRFPLEMVSKSRYFTKYFDRYGRVRIDQLSSSSSNYLKDFLRNELYFNIFQENDNSSILSLFQDLLIIDPSKRLIPKEALNYSFLN